ncbi:hypothetical protein EJ994_13590 [Maribacter sp. MJ134]|uniref:hypothetical protein n=1 Tax=Maribacter sp. MJ134 TaxID=2496865 RepID=UPI000F84753A|nr:hypothetical protein [Maribacter sp. MJ134]AZQ59778.1 hypothetical protein EJ994_13590 [Maribacter sp. MJ134]
MNKKILDVLKGYSKLSLEEKAILKKHIQRLDNTGIDGKKIIIKALSESVGPLDSNACSCCGR